MQKQAIHTIDNSACETADSIFGARERNMAEDANAMHDLIFWDMLGEQSGICTADVLSIQGRGA
ncbi:hypothetical protein [Paraburkholderia sp. BL17N1]|uniref:hypothetical protein n=1 Tax=Paraburkholderia sp. BL17N1 TaxID=1938798 RepID=UPI000EB0062E|nr:hypothetical protein [Paraburkholderia sp. BL17N1]RKR31660.1 hypothetical protein B0G82_7880 [Paraburkholderia sp. BL17N1]